MVEVDVKDGSIVIDAAVIGKALGIEEGCVQSLMREGKVTALSETGIDSDAGTYRLTFFYNNRRARLIVSDRGRILRRSSIDMGDRAIPAVRRQPRC